MTFLMKKTLLLGFASLLLFSSYSQENTDKSIKKPRFQNSKIWGYRPRDLGTCGNGLFGTQKF